VSIIAVKALKVNGILQISRFLFYVMLQLSVLWYCGIRRTAAEETGKAVAVFSAPMDSSERAAAAIPVPDAKLVL
jgi:hypothetical protein